MTIRTDEDILDLRKAGDLTSAEETLIENCRAGEPTMLGEDVPYGPSDARTVRADLLRYLITGGCEKCPTQDAGVQLVGAYVTSDLDLDFATAKGLTWLSDCRFAEPIAALQARFEFLSLNRSHLPGLNAQGARVAGNVFLRGATVAGELSLSGAGICGHLDCNEARFENAKGKAINAQSARVTGSLFLNKVQSKGEMSLSGAALGGQLSCNGAMCENARGDALNAQGLQVSGGVFLREVTAVGEVRLSGARIVGHLDCAGAQFENARGDALDAQGLQLTGGVFLREVSAAGEVRLLGAGIGGQLDCEGARFENAGGRALNAQGVQVAGDVFLSELERDGETKKFEAKGELRLLGANISGQLVCEGARFENAERRALNAEKVEVEEFHWCRVAGVSGAVDLTGARAADLVDDAESWDLVDDLLLNGFRYERIHGPMNAQMRLDWVAKDAATDSEFCPHPYEQLARVYKSMGHETDCRRVLIAKENLQRADERKRMRGVLGSVQRARKRLTDFLSWLVVGYGYRPFRALYLFLVLWAIGAGISYQAWHAGDFAPNSDVILSTPDWQALASEGSGVDNPAAAWSAEAGKGRDWETFQPLAYAFDIVVPIVTIGQTEAWAPSTTRGPWGWNLWWARWVLTVLGWIVTAVGAAAITGIIRRE